MKNKIIAFVLIFAVAFIFSGCATQSLQNVGNLPGFFKGLFHGFIIVFSFILSWFTDYEIYAYPNSGGWYNFGYLLGVMCFFGGGGAGVKCKR